MINIIVDTREQMPWDFTFHGFKSISRKLKVADYSIEGLEDYILIERKASTGEIALNLGKKLKQFNKELSIMGRADNKFIICEFSLNDMTIFPVDSGIPKSKWKDLIVTANYLTYKLHELAGMYGIKILYCNTRHEANQKAAEILEYAYKERRNSKAPW